MGLLACQCVDLLLPLSEAKSLGPRGKDLLGCGRQGVASGIVEKKLRTRSTHVRIETHPVTASLVTTVEV